MPVEIQIQQIAGEALRMSLGARRSLSAEWRPPEIADGERFAAAMLVSGGQAEVLDFVEIRKLFVPFLGVPYHQWLISQRALDFWKVASSWSVFWQAVWLCQFTDVGLDNWPHLVDHPLPSEPLLPFLDVSHGYLQWDWQIELLYRLCDADRQAAERFRKDWNAGKLEASAAAERMSLPSGVPLFDVLKARARPGGWQAVRGVPTYAATRLLSALAARLH
jgi:hypothetical protein